MNLLPSTLFGRLVAALVLAVGITLAVIVALIVQDRYQLTLHVGGVGITSQRIAGIVRTLEELDPEARTVERRRLSADESLRIDPPPYTRANMSRREFAAIERAFASELRGLLGDRHRVSLIRMRGENSRRVIRLVDQRHGVRTDFLDVSVSLPGGDTFIFRVAPPPPAPPIPWELFGQFGVLTLVLAAVLFLVTRSITRPLSDLARAADAVGRSIRHPPLAEEGVREIREATRAFNTMQDRLLRYVDSRTRVLAAMSHDLRTPLTRLRLRVESVSDEQLRTRFVADLDEMEALVRGALGLFRGLDDDEAFEPLDVNRLLETLVAEYTEVGANVSVEGTARGPVQAKARALKRCLTNLVDNALKFGNRAAIRVDDGDEALVISVSDDGAGIPEDMLERVFEPFYRLESSRSRDSGGTGLGLSIARDLAQAHGGTLTLRNRAEGGLTAQLRLPRK